MIFDNFLIKINLNNYLLLLLIINIIKHNVEMIKFVSLSLLDYRRI